MGTLNASFPVVDLFYSLQGEGELTGVPSVFVRLAGCPVRCRWCDTKYAWSADDYPHLTGAQIVDQVRQYQCRHVVLTGGEPLIHRRIGSLIDSLGGPGRHVTVETAGTVYRKFRCQLVSISPKLPSVLKHRRSIQTFRPDLIRRLASQAERVQLKFVVAKRTDVKDILNACDRLPFIGQDRIMLMPQAATRAAYLRHAPRVARWALEYGFQFSPRLQLVLNLK